MKAIPNGQYPGGKGAGGLAPWILRQLPAHEVFVETFAGKAAVTRAKLPALRTLLLEKSGWVCDWLRGEVGYAEVRNSCGVAWLQSLVDAGPGGLAELGEDRVVVYCDPPYVLSTRVKTEVYEFEWSDMEHDQFLEVVSRVPCAVAISGYWSQKYEDGLPGWEVSRTMSQTRGGLREECLWRNPLCVAGVVADGEAKPVREYSGFGEGWRERHRVEKLVGRWRKNFIKRPERERRAILEGLLREQRDAGAGMSGLERAAAGDGEGRSTL